MSSVTAGQSLSASYKQLQSTDVHVVPLTFNKHAVGHRYVPGNFSWVTDTVVGPSSSLSLGHFGSNTLNKYVHFNHWKLCFVRHTDTGGQKLCSNPRCWTMQSCLVDWAWYNVKYLKISSAHNRQLNSSTVVNWQAGNRFRAVGIIMASVMYRKPRTFSVSTLLLFGHYEWSRLSQKPSILARL